MSNSHIVKKFINNVNTCVDDFLTGLVASRQDLIFHPSNHRVILRNDYEKIGEDGIVALITGGGSGHEPFAAGFVGQNGFTAAVAGDVFAAPPSDNISDAVKAVKGKGGAIVFVNNYTGDRLNFGMAVERVKAEYKDYSVEMVIIDDDIALEEKTDFMTGGRGLAGCLFVFQIIGVLSDTHHLPIYSLVEASHQLIRNLATFGVTVYPCSIPGKPLMFELGDDELELGLGVHGEPGCERTKIMPAKELIEKILRKLVNSKRLELKKSEKIAVLLNNLGGTTQMEMLILTKEILFWLESNGYEVVRFISGTILSSFESHGISVSILKLLDPAWINYLDTPSPLAKYWISSSPSTNKILQNGQAHKQKQEKILEFGIKIAPQESKMLEKCLRKSAEALIAQENELNRLDSAIGDGDCGSTMRTACESILKAADSKGLNFIYPMTLFLQLSKIFEKNVGGTTGALYALMLSAAAQSFENMCSQKEFYESLKNGLHAIMKYGGAKPGYRTMVDPLNSAVETKNEPKNQEDWEKLVEGAKKSAQDTATMTAKAGRASYTAENLQTEPDPGALAVSIWIQAIYDSYFS